MVRKSQRKSRRRKLLEKDSEEKLLQRIAKIQALLEEEDVAENDHSNFHHNSDSSDDENNESQKNKRTRQGSPFPSSVRSSSLESENCDKSDEPGHHLHWGNQPFYCLPANAAIPSTSRGYSNSFDKNFQQQKFQASQREPDNFKNSRRDFEEEKPAMNTSEDVWVPLTFLDPNQKSGIQNASVKPSSRLKNKKKTLAAKTSENVWVPPKWHPKQPQQKKGIQNSELKYPPKPKILDLSPRINKVETPREEIRERDKDYYRKRRASPGSSSGTSEAEFLERSRREVNTESRLNEIKKRETNYYKSAQRFAELNPGSSELRQKIKTENPPIHVSKRNDYYKKRKDSTEWSSGSCTEISRSEFLEPTHRKIKIENSPIQVKESKNDYYRKIRDSAEWNSESCSGIVKSEFFEPTRQKIKIENPSEEIENPNLGKIPTELSFSACVSIAAKLPEETLLPLKFLQIPPLKIKVENQSELIAIEGTSSESSKPVSRGQIEKVEDMNEMESVSSKENIVKMAADSLKKETLDEIEEGEEFENNGTNKKIDFSTELKKFSNKLKMLKGVAVEDKINKF